tara:strand:+ start:538 stop:828 length:291 start_codon:yes stop_codon:yes gene_type:complete
MKYITLNQGKYFSLILVLSFFLLHNIYIVIFGIIIALYEINKNYIYNLIKFNSKNKSSQEDSEYRKLNSEVSRLKLVDAIEELGFIPSRDNDDDGG